MKMCNLKPVDNISTGKVINLLYKFFFGRKLQLYYGQEHVF